MFILYFMCIHNLGHARVAFVKFKNSLNYKEMSLIKESLISSKLNEFRYF